MEYTCANVYLVSDDLSYRVIAHFLDKNVSENMKLWPNLSFHLKYDKFDYL